jgi:hypothetical protein
MADDPDHPDRILLKPFIRVTNGPDDPSLEIGHPADMVNNGEICNIVEKAIDGDVSALGIVLRCSKTVCPDDIPFLRLYLLEFRTAPKRRDLDDLSAFEEDLNQSKSSTDDAAVSEKVIDLLGVSVGRDIEVFWDLS